MEIQEALRALDHTDDAHWTKQGQPDLTVLTEMVGSRVTRKQAEEAMPGLKRDPSIPVQAPEVEVQEPVLEPRQMDTLQQAIVAFLGIVDARQNHTMSVNVQNAAKLLRKEIGNA